MYIYFLELGTCRGLGMWATISHLLCNSLADWACSVNKLAASIFWPKWERGVVKGV